MTVGFLAVLLLLAVPAVGALATLASRSRDMPVQTGLIDERLAPCPDAPNCVSSDAAPTDSHYVAPIADPAGTKWASLIGKVGAMNGTRLIAADGHYAHFTFTTRLMRFVDDVEFHHRPARGEIAIRSASRVGRADLNANRNRLEAIRAAL